MSARPARIVDPHVHLWDPARTDWYPYLSGGRELNMGDVSGMSRRFDVPTYRSESAGWNVEKLVNVAAATGMHSVDETLELDRQADRDDGGQPDAIVGGLPPTETIAEGVALLDRQMGATRFRGVRPMGVSSDPLPPDELLGALEERGLLFELMAHPDQLVDAAQRLERFEDLVVVVEHTGWPRSADGAERQLWTSGMDALAALGDRVVCKLSGLAMPLGSMRVDALGPWLTQAIETFGVDRCMFASNFPVDAMHGTFDELYTTFTETVAGLGDDAVDKLFATNAERVYRI
ncbi:MAG: amidohydrolase family protein [Acidimicrobiia bacterium]|nr:amidohydrolase family protein [Acidimicrobiia bacterium]